MKGMKKIYRYELPVDGKTHTLAIPAYYLAQRILRVEAARNDLIEFWVTVGHPDAVGVGPAHEHLLTAIGTGHEVPDGGVVLGTTARTPSGFVWHLVEIEAV